MKPKTMRLSLKDMTDPKVTELIDSPPPIPASGTIEWKSGTDLVIDDLTSHQRWRVRDGKTVAWFQYRSGHGESPGSLHPWEKAWFSNDA